VIAAKSLARKARARRCSSIDHSRFDGRVLSAMFANAHNLERIRSAAFSHRLTASQHDRVAVLQIAARSDHGFGGEHAESRSPSKGTATVRTVSTG
jgi:hypothetical protein